MSTPNPEARRLIRAYLLACLPLDTPADHALRAGLEATTPGDALPKGALTAAAALGPFRIARLSDLVNGTRPLTAHWIVALGGTVAKPPPSPAEAECLALLQAGSPDVTAALATGLSLSRVKKIRDEAGIAPLPRGRRWPAAKIL
jgi:hypothetical protein